jgi:outer membrane protein OmpA-like peptidoglycan-associated protein
MNRAWLVAGFGMLGLGLSMPASAVLPAQVDLEVELAFMDRSTALDVEEREKIVRAIRRIRDERWCSIKVAGVVGYLDRGERVESSTSSLSEHRARAVSAFLVELGVQPSIVYWEGLNRAAPGNHGAKLMIAGSPPRSDCPYGVGANGFSR